MSALSLSVSPATGDTLSLKGLHTALTDKGASIAYTTLSELISAEDVAAQLGAGGQGARRQFHPDVADVLAGFLTEFREAGGKMPQAPAMLRAFLKQRMSGDGGALVPTRAALPSAAPVDALAVAAMQGRAQGLAEGERVLTAKEAAEMLRVSPRTLRASVAPYKRFGSTGRGDRWLLSDLLTK